MLLAKNKYRIRLYEGEEIEFRTLSANSVDQAYSALKKSGENPLCVEQIFNFITENRYASEDVRAGIPNMVIFACLKLSGTIKSPADLPDFYDNARKAISDDLFFQIFSYIVKVMPSYKLDELRAMSTRELFELIAFAEKVIDKQFIDTDKMRKSLEAPEETVSEKKGVKNVTPEEIDFIKNLLDQDEARMEGMPSY